MVLRSLPLNRSLFLRTMCAPFANASFLGKIQPLHHNARSRTCTHAHALSLTSLSPLSHLSLTSLSTSLSTSRPLDLSRPLDPSRPSLLLIPHQHHPSAVASSFCCGCHCFYTGRCRSLVGFVFCQQRRHVAAALYLCRHAGCKRAPFAPSCLLPLACPVIVSALYRSPFTGPFPRTAPPPCIVCSMWRRRWLSGTLPRA